MPAFFMLDEITKAGEEFDAALAAANDARSLDDLRVRYFGRKGGLIPALFAKLKDVPKEQKKEAGDALNKLRDRIEAALKEKQERVAAEEAKRKEAREIIDVTLPARMPRSGHLHPVTLVRQEIEGIFREMGYSIDPGPEIETDWYNFGALNFTPDHPARDTQDTFFLDAKQSGEPLLLRTHTSNVQIRTMERFKPPVKVLSCGRVFRRDEITMRRSPMFHQAEGLLVDHGIHIGHLRATLEHMIRRLFGEQSQMRMRPSYFPFTEPSAEVDMSCVFCKGAGCGTCSQTGWMEILGCGMVHPQVLRNCGIDPEEWSGFAFGLGIDRVAMLKYDIPNIRTLFENDLRVLSQF
ncbi:MAG TPA: phenylalanine--tRNA ligase subunit alpha [Thermoanaerobaculia bacterium]|nr:phenylalanine--tRNA ligase subunit alpha [Thermoanaerobaculia bacterium]